MKLELVGRDVSLRDFANHSGLSYNTLRCEVGKGLTSKRFQARIEDALGTAIFSEAAEFAERQRLTRLFGFNPVLSTLRGLQLLARDRRVPGWPKVASKRAALTQLIAAHLTQSQNKKVEHGD